MIVQSSVSKDPAEITKAEIVEFEDMKFQNNRQITASTTTDTSDNIEIC